MTTIAEGFGQLGLSITNKQIHDMEKASIYFVLRKTHPLTFDGPYLGLHPIAFTTSDYNALFDTFKIRKQDVEMKVREIRSIDRNFIVTSDPYNLLCMWLCHLAPIFIKDKKIQHNFMMDTLRLYHYKTFCSVVNNSFRHGTKEGVLLSTISNLSRKSDIIRYESWKRLIDAHCEKMLDPQDRFYPVLVEGGPDEAFLRVIQESQTALRAKIVTFANAYYDTHSSGESVQSKSAISENADGERILAQTASVIDSATQAMVAEILNPNMFIHDVSVDGIADTFQTVSSRQLKTALLKINETAVLQSQMSSKVFDKIIKDKEGTLYVGVRILIIEIIRSMVRLCRERRINMGNSVSAFNEMRKAYSSSRNLDKDIIDIKRSVSHLVDPFNISVNAASQSALRLAVIYYILYRMLLRMK